MRTRAHSPGPAPVQCERLDASEIKLPTAELEFCTASAYTNSEPRINGELFGVRDRPSRVLRTSRGSVQGVSGLVAATPCARRMTFEMQQ